MRHFTADLHIHTALSPCAAREMTPDSVVGAAIAAGLHIIAICDHNATGNVTAVMDAAEDRLTVIAGMEVTTSEEVHVLGLFPDNLLAEAAGREVGASLPSWSGTRENTQLLMDSAGGVTGREPKMLSASVSFDLNASVSLLRRYSGIVLAAHVDRRTFNVFSQLGFVPENVVFDGVERAQVVAPPPWGDRIESMDLPMLASSDSHYLEQVGAHRTVFELMEPTFVEVQKALRGEQGRRIAGYA